MVSGIGLNFVFERHSDTEMEVMSGLTGLKYRFFIKMTKKARGTLISFLFIL